MMVLQQWKSLDHVNEIAWWWRGEGRRFGGADKPLAIFNGKLGRPMVDYVIHRLPEHSFIHHANRNFERYALRGHRVDRKLR